VYEQIWQTYDPEAEKASDKTNGANGHAQPPSARKEYIDILISDLRTDPLGISIQVLKDGGRCFSLACLELRTLTEDNGAGIPELEQLMRDFSLHHSQSTAKLPAQPRSGDRVSARFSVDNAWYRAKVLKSNPQKKEATVRFEDYGNSGTTHPLEVGAGEKEADGLLLLPETLSYDEIRPLDNQFRKLEPQAKEATLSFIKLLGNESEYGAEAVDRFRQLAEARRFAAEVISLFLLTLAGFRVARW
jgi:staphylococcal nuclease domain-containing protein 1